MTVAEFNDQVNVSLDRVKDRNGADVQAEQERLRRLLPQLEAHDRAWAEGLIDDLPRRANPPAPSAVMTTAMRIQDQAFFGAGTVEERIARMAAARRRILELAEQASTEDRAGMIGLVRSLEHLEAGLREPYPPFDSRETSASI
jgi:hypothetical protein